MGTNETWLGRVWSLAAFGAGIVVGSVLLTCNPARAAPPADLLASSTRCGPRLWELAVAKEFRAAQFEANIRSAAAVAGVATPFEFDCNEYPCVAGAEGDVPYKDMWDELKRIYGPSAKVSITRSAIGGIGHFVFYVIHPVAETEALENRIPYRHDEFVRMRYPAGRRSAPAPRL